MDLDEFSDDDFGDLADDDLLELENKAIHSTQTKASVPAPGRPQQRTIPTDTRQPQHHDSLAWQPDDADEEDLDTTEVTDAAGGPIGRPPISQALHSSQQFQPRPVQNAPVRRPPVPNPNWNPNLNTSNRPSGGIPRPIPPRFPSSGNQNQYPLRLSQPSDGASLARAQGITGRPTVSQASQNAPHLQRPLGASQAPGDVVGALQQRLRALESELNAAKGEASILRSNTAKAQQQHDVEVARLKRLNAEQMSKQERIAEAAVTAEKNANTELQFLQRDMREANRVRRQQSDPTGGRPKDPKAGASKPSTPRKGQRSWGLADGFDDSAMVISPSKGGRRGNAGSVAANVGERTPTKGKRKRLTVDSPVLALEMHTDDMALDTEPIKDRPPKETREAPVDQQLPFNYLHLVLEHAVEYEQPLTFDAFSRFAFPSEPQTSLASILFKELPRMGDKRPLQLLVDFSAVLCGLWSKCLEEQYWDPVKHLVSLIAFTFQLYTGQVAPSLIADLLPPAQETIRLITDARHLSQTGDLKQDPQLAAVAALADVVDVSEIMSLLWTTAAACMTSLPETMGDSMPGRASGRLIVDFWRRITLEFAMILLSPKQETQDITGILALLATSSLRTSIGPIPDDEETPAARVLVGRVSAKLVETPRATITAAEGRLIRIEALRTLIAFASQPFGAIQLATHGHVLPRLVTCLSAAIDSLYDMSVPPSLFEPEASSAAALTRSHRHESVDLNQIITLSVSLIHTLVTGPHTANVADISEKLSVFYGGSERYLIALGRLTFAEEDYVMEAGIESETVEMAHDLLEMKVTPEEGAMVAEAFSS